MDKPQLNDFVIIYGYFGKQMELGRVKTLVDKKIAINGLAQNNPDWVFTEFWLDIDKFKYTGSEIIDGSKVWTAEKLTQ
jgi:hypothetical protein